MNPVKLDPITIVTQSCEPERPLEADDKRYVPLSEARGEPFPEKGGWRHRMALSLRRADRATTVLVSGFIGDGKTTELKRLQRELTVPTSGEPLAVVYIDAAQYMNMEEYSFTEVLLAIITETGEQLRKNYGIELRPGYWSRKLDEMKGTLLSEVELESLSAEVGLSPYKFAAKIALKARGSDVTRKQLWAALGGERSTLVAEFGKAINEQARPELRKKGYKDLVIIIDMLEKLVRKAGDKPNDPNTHEQLFLHSAPLFQQLGAHLVLTVPIEMVYSSVQERLTLAYGRQPEVMSCIRVADCLPEADRKLACEAMCGLLAKRFEDAPGGRVEFKEVFPDRELAHEIIRFSGGHPRSLLILIRDCLSFLDALPITHQAFLAAKKLEVKNAAFKIKEGWYPKLAEITKTHQIQNDDDHQEMLRNLCVLAYSNGQPQYAVDPAIVELMKLRHVI